MKRIFLFRSFIFVCFLILASCGSDKKAVNIQSASSGSNSLTGTECACSSAYAPVCGVNNVGKKVSYDNQCIASCFKATSIVQGNCDCSETLIVCGSDGSQLTECEAVRKNIQISKYGSCSSASF
jgi:hypothetical protein